MKYVGTIYADVIIAKGKNYTDIVDENEIELTEEQYNTIPIPCRLVEGEFVKCDYPAEQAEIIHDPLGIQDGGTGATTAEEALKNLGACRIITGSYAGTCTSSTLAPVDIHFDEFPLLMLVQCGEGFAIVREGLGTFITTYNGTVISNTTVSYYTAADGSATVRWTLSSVSMRTTLMNNAGTSYKYFAFFA